jgi:hypothetical protein
VLGSGTYRRSEVWDLSDPLRRYRFDIGWQPAMEIREWFLRAAADLVADRLG